MVSTQKPSLSIEPLQALEHEREVIDSNRAAAPPARLDSRLWIQSRADRSAFTQKSGGRSGDPSVLLAGLAMFGIGSGCMMTPVSWAAVHTLNSTEVADGSTLFNVNRNMAASVGTASMSVILTSRSNSGARLLRRIVYLRSSACQAASTDFNRAGPR
jgi:hypothetical protein